jgi:SAM-dependent methyltransferase
MSTYRESLDYFLSKTDVSVNKVLDIGGSANPTKGRTKSWDVKNYLILDNNIEENTEGHWTKPDIIYDINIRPISGLDFDEAFFEKNLIESFDLIFCLEVFEYVWSPIEALQNIKDLMTKDGKAIITFPTLYPVHQPIIHDALRYTEFGIYKLMERVELEVESMTQRYVKYPDLLSQFYKAEGLHPAKHYPYHPIFGWICEVKK